MKRAILILTLITLVLLTASCVFASDDAQAAEISQGDEIDGISVCDDNQVAEQDNGGSLSSENDSEILTEDICSFSELSDEIGSGGDITLKHAYYSYKKQGSITISITTRGVIDGNGAIIDLEGSTIQAFNVEVSRVTFKNLTIKNCYSFDDGGAIHFSKSGTVENCNFINNRGNYGGAIYFENRGTVKNCNFINNTAQSRAGGAIFFENMSTVENCNFINNYAWKGGSILSEYEFITVKNCNFTDNSGQCGGAIRFFDGAVTNCNFINNEVTGDYSYGSAIDIRGFGTVTNCNFTNNTAGYRGGAIYFDNSSTFENCNFNNNSAKYGGAINTNVKVAINATVKNCNFTDNNATYRGGAIHFEGKIRSTIENCNFNNNSAKYGGAIDCGGNWTITNCNFINNAGKSDSGGDGGAIHIYGNGNVTNCNFVNNSANRYGGAIYKENAGNVVADTCLFKTASDTTYQVSYLPPTLNVDNSTSYKSGEKLLIDLKTNSGMSVGNANISISIYHKDNNSWVGNYSCLSGKGWIIDLPAGHYYAVFNTEYNEFQPVNITLTVMPGINYYVSIIPLTTTSKTVNITAKSNIPNDVIQGRLVFILPNGAEIDANYNDDGTWWAIYKFNAYGKYNINAHYTGLNGVVINKATIEVKDTSKVTAKGTAKSTVKKTTPKITAKNKSLKAKTKSKKYTVTLKNNAGKPMKKVQLTLKVKGKTFKATTNSKGKATFKITKLSKKGKYPATITYKGNSKYNKTTKKVKIILK